MSEPFKITKNNPKEEQLSHHVNWSGTRSTFLVSLIRANSKKKHSLSSGVKNRVVSEEKQGCYSNIESTC